MIEASGASLHAVRSRLLVAANDGSEPRALRGCSGVPSAIKFGTFLSSTLQLPGAREATDVLIGTSAKSSRRHHCHSTSAYNGAHSFGHTARTLRRPVPCGHTSDQRSSQEMLPCATRAHENRWHEPVWSCESAAEACAASVKPRSKRVRNGRLIHDGK